MNNFNLGFGVSYVNVMLDYVFSIGLDIYIDNSFRLVVTYKIDNKYFIGCILNLNEKLDSIDIKRFINDVKYVVEKTNCKFDFTDFREV